jgi:hypothetical protein
LAALLVDDDISLEEAMAFIQELIDSQLLVSELEPAVTGKDFLIQLSTILQTIPVIEEKREKLARIAALLSEIDSSGIGTTLPKYAAIEEVVKELGTAYEAKFLFQTDMCVPLNKAVLDKKIIPSLLEALELMNKLTSAQSETLLSQFAKDYYERYEDSEMPLLEVLDTENGIGFRQGSGDISPLLGGYVLPAQHSESADIKWNRIQSALHRKFLEAYKANDYTVVIEEKDVDFLQANWDDLPSTLSSMCEFFTDKDQSLIHIHHSGGSSAANILGRFCHVNKELENYVKEITAFEQLQRPDIIYAEVVHLPESRVGNILLRPILRPYEIPYLGRPSVEEEFQISLSDLYVSVKGKNVSLRSKRLNKTIIPRLSTAHNYSFNSMPVYHFLCSMQTQGLRGAIGFHWGSVTAEYDFLPRVTYKNIVLSLAKWTVKTADFTKLLGMDNKKQDKKDASLQIPETAMQALKKWCADKQLPRYVVLPDGDNALFVDMENSLSIQTLLSVIKKRSSFQLEEFPFEKEKAMVKNGAGESFTNEFIFGFYKSQQHG